MSGTHDDDTPPPVAIRAELAHSLGEYRRAFLAWAVAAYAVEMELPAQIDRYTRLIDARTRARWHRDDTHIQLVADLFTYAGEEATDE